MNIIKQTPYFPGFVLCHVPVVCCLMMAKGTCIYYCLWLNGYHKYIHKQTMIIFLTITWKWTGPLIIPQYRYTYLDHFAKQIKAHLMLLHVPHVIKKQKKLGQIGSDLSNFFTAKVFYCIVFLIECSIDIFWLTKFYKTKTVYWNDTVLLLLTEIYN